MTRSRSVLIVAPLFPPLTTVPVHRMYRLAKYLPELGWNVHVLTMDWTPDGVHDPTLLNSLPDSVQITRARCIEPSVRGLRRLTVRSESSDVIGTVRAEAPRGQPEGVAVTARSLLHPLYQAVLRELWQIPDQYWTWRGPALRAAKALVREHEIPIVVTTTPPWTGHGIGAKLQRQGVRWVADFQDPPVYMHHLHGERDRHLTQQRRIEAMAVKQADVVTVASEGIGMILKDMHGPKSLHRWETIPLGVDSAMLESGEPLAAPPFPYLVFPGRFSREYGSEFFEIFARALDDPTVRATSVKLVMVGDLRENRSVAGPLIEKYGLQHHVELRDFVPQRDLLSLLDRAMAGVLLDGSTARWWCIHAKAVEYLGLGKPVVARIPRVSVSRVHLEETRLGVLLDGEIDQAASTLKEFLLGQREPGPVDRVALRRFTARGQAEAFTILFDQLMRG